MRNKVQKQDENNEKQPKKKPNLLEKLPFFRKLKSIKNIELIIAVFLISVMLLIFFGSSSDSKKQTVASTSEMQLLSNENYVADLQKRIEHTLSKIEGAGQVNVVITLSSSSELVIAKDVEKTTHIETITKDGVTTKTEEIVILENPILVNGKNGDEPLVLIELAPKIAGVVVVAEGAKDVNVKLNLLKAIQALITVPSGNIEILF